MSTRFFTNDNANTLLKKFEGIFEHNPDLARFDALVGYLTEHPDISQSVPTSEKSLSLRILVGINVDNIVEEYHERGSSSSQTLGKL